MTSDHLKEQAKVSGHAWASTPYYDNAEKLTYIFWDEQTPFRQMFDSLDLKNTIELSCGHGRHAEIAAPKCGQLVLMDIFEANLDFCRDRLRNCDNVSYELCNGYSFEPIQNDSITAIYCYDAMVHFQPDVVKSYLKDTFRVLKPGGRALYHHSNYLAPLDQPYGKNPHARNHMTKDLFFYFSALAGLEIVDSRMIKWGGIDNLDCITMVQRPA